MPSCSAPRLRSAQQVRIGDRRVRVIGVLASQGQHLGFNTDEIVIVPVAFAQSLFNTNTLLRILVEARSRDALDLVKTEVASAIQARHEGELDVTVVTQDAVLATFDRVLRALTLAVGGIAAISLGVAGILIMNVMLIAVSQRTREIGLLKAVGAAPSHIRTLFFAEAVVLSSIGAAVGLALGLAGNALIVRFYPLLPAAAAGVGSRRGPHHCDADRGAVQHPAGAPRRAAGPGARVVEALAQ